MVILDEIWRPIVGGILLSLASSTNLYLKGRITGFSGIFFGMITLKDYIWKLSFISGVLWISNLFYAFSPSEKNFFDSHENFMSDLSLIGFSISGFLVGVGTKLANGCTSGHGLCGLARLSRRSIVAVLVFLSFAIFSCTLRSNYPFLDSPDLLENSIYLDKEVFHYILTLLFTILLIVLLFKSYSQKDFVTFLDVLINFITGSLMGLGLIISGMNKRTKVRDFLNINAKTWDPTLMILLGVGVGLNLVFYFLVIKKMDKPILDDKMGIPTNTKIDLPLVIGSAIFGIGWGWSGICPGPALVNVFIYIPHVLLFSFCMAIGQVVINSASVLWT